MNGPFPFAVHQNGPLGGRLLPHLGNLPGKGPFSRKVLRFSGGPSMLGAIFPEGPALFRGTFHARGRFPGRSGAFPGDLPCQGPFFRKVLRFSGGPSMPGVVFPEGPAFFRGTFHARSHFPGRSCAFPGDLPRHGPFFRKVLRFSGGPSMPGAVFPEGPAFFRGTFHARGRFSGRSCAFPGDLPCQGPFSRKVRRFSGGPSMLEAVFPEGPAFFRGTFHARGRFPGRSANGLANGTANGSAKRTALWPGSLFDDLAWQHRQNIRSGSMASAKVDDLAVWHRQKEYNPAGGRWQKVCDSGRD